MPCGRPAWPTEDLARLHSPIGLDLGAVTPAEVAVSITAELVASRSKAAGLAQGSVSLKDASGPIHHYAAHIRQRRRQQPSRQQRRHAGTSGGPVDMNTIEAVVRTADPAAWRDGDAWLAGGTVLFSYGSPAFGQEPLRRLLDLGSAAGHP